MKALGSRTPSPKAVRDARRIAALTQTQAANLVGASLRAWQQWERGDRTMPRGLFELFMIKTGQWSLRSIKAEDKEQ